MNRLACVPMVLGAALGIALTVSPSTSLAGPYEDCILQNMKNVADRMAAAEIRRACRIKTTPVKCRQYLPSAKAAEEGIWREFELDACLKECEQSPATERSRGECRIDGTRS